MNKYLVRHLLSCLILCPGIVYAEYYIGYTYSNTYLNIARDTVSKSSGSRVSIGAEHMRESNVMSGLEVVFVDSGDYGGAKTSATMLNAIIYGDRLNNGFSYALVYGITQWRVDYSGAYPEDDGYSESKFLYLKYQFNRFMEVRFEWGGFDAKIASYPGQDASIEMRGVGLSVVF